MAIDDKRGQMGGSSGPLGERSAPKPEIPADRTPWGGSEFLSGEKLRNWARSDKAYDQTGGMYESERLERANKIFGSSGDYLNKGKAREILRKLQEKKAYAQTDKDIAEATKDIKIVESLLKE
jgi:hypothetical protein